MKRMSEALSGFWEDEDGLGTLEILLIVAVLVIIAIALPMYLKR
ncbi:MULTISPECIES: Flp1 family type IVb pilin [unclassified Paenibacillus]